MVKLRRMIWDWHVARMGAMRNKYKILLGKKERKRPLGKNWRRFEDIIILKWIYRNRFGWCGLDSSVLG
jgi:hypothetical protein